MQQQQPQQHQTSQVEQLWPPQQQPTQNSQSPQQPQFQAQSPQPQSISQQPNQQTNQQSNQQPNQQQPNQQPSLLGLLPLLMQFQQQNNQQQNNQQQSNQQQQTGPNLFLNLLSSIPPQQLFPLMSTLLNSPVVQQAIPQLIETFMQSQQPQRAQQPQFSPPPQPTSNVRHHATCDNCFQNIVGIRYKCSSCDDFDLCSACEELENVHDKSHVFYKIRYLDVNLPNFPTQSKQEQQPATSTQQQSIKSQTPVQQQPAQSQTPVQQSPQSQQPIQQQPMPFQFVPVDLVNFDETQVSVQKQQSPIQQSIQPQKYQFESELKSLIDMGFPDMEKNRNLLTLYHGNLDNVIQHLLSGNN